MWRRSFLVSSVGITSPCWHSYEHVVKSGRIRFDRVYVFALYQDNGTAANHSMLITVFI